MQGHQDSRRVRNVPIRIEGEHSRGYDTEPRRNHRDQDHGQGRGYESQMNPMDNYSQHFYDPNRLNQKTSPHTSSININYKPQQQTNKCNDQAKAPDASSGEPHLQANNSSRLGAQPTNRQEPGKENSGTNAFKQSDDCFKQDTARHTAEERKPSPIPPVIPLPPPPGQATPMEHVQMGGQENQPQQQQPQQQQQARSDQEEHKAKSVKQETGPLAVINATKTEVKRLLQEVAKCEETSTRSKEFLRLEELLTLCILKLDNIDASELRQQRKEVINMINKCTDILERKINLNNDIQQLTANCQ